MNNLLPAWYCLLWMLCLSVYKISWNIVVLVLVVWAATSESTDVWWHKAWWVGCWLKKAGKDKGQEPTKWKVVCDTKIAKKVCVFQFLWLSVIVSILDRNWVWFGCVNAALMITSSHLSNTSPVDHHTVCITVTACLWFPQKSLLFQLKRTPL